MVNDYRDVIASSLPCPNCIDEVGRSNRTRGRASQSETQQMHLCWIPFVQVV